MATTLEHCRDSYRRIHVAEIDYLERSIHGAVGSPIEESMVWALLNPQPDNQICEWYTATFLPSRFILGGDADTPYLSIASDSRFGYKPSFGLQPTIHAGGRTYRLDISVAVDCGRDSSARVWLDVECDGHDFHERTKEQAEADKRRDRDLQSIGWTVARFTGAEIFRDASAAAQSVNDLWWRLINQRMDTERAAIELSKNEVS